MLRFKQAIPRGRRAKRRAPSPATWFCLARRPRRQTSVAARRATRRRTSVVVGDNVVDRRTLNVRRARLRCGGCRNGGAEHNSNDKGSFFVGEHCRISSRRLCGYTQEETVNLANYSRSFAVAASLK